MFDSLQAVSIILPSWSANVILSVWQKKKTNTTKKSTYRGNKKPSMQARKRATQVTNQKKKQNRNTQPIPKTPNYFQRPAGYFRYCLILGSTFSLGAWHFKT